MDVELVDLHEDMHRDERDDRWLLVYNVPPELAHDGTYSVSMPKGMINDFASTYGYDLDDEADVDDMFDHLFSLPFVAEVARREGRNAEAGANPYEMPIETAKRFARTQVQEFKQSHSLKQKPPSANLRAAGGLVKDGDILGHVRRDMLSRASAEVVRDAVTQKAEIRQEVQGSMLDMAMRMKASRA